MTANLHWRTPTLTVNDARGLPVRQVDYFRGAAAEAPAALVSRQRHDRLGRLVEQWDPRLSAPCLSTVYSLHGQVLKSDSVDAGWRLKLPGLAGEPLQRWDQRKHHWRTTFDQQLRVIAVEENGETYVDVFSYADASSDAGHNRRGRLLEQKDRSGSLLTDSFSLVGSPLRETRTFHDGQAFTSQHAFSPLGVLLEQTDAGGHQRRSRYGLAGQLKQADLRISGTPEWQAVLRDAQYNANDQIIEELAGNRVLSAWTYAPADGRLHTRSGRKEGGVVLQDFEYFYDRVGNITRIEDHAFQPRYFANQLTDGHRDFTYDSLYRLIRATGYDDAPPAEIPGLPQPGDPNNRLNYTRSYRYDNGGNLIELRHVRDGNNSTRTMRIDPHSNRAVRWTAGDPEPVFDDLFDCHGNQKALHSGKPMIWNARDELERVILLQRENALPDAEHYRYSQGIRVFKRHECHTPTAEHVHQVYYLPGLEVRTCDNGEVLHVITLGNARCLHWEKRKPDTIANDQMRYTLADHLGSCVMELDQQADLASQEGYYPFGATAWFAARHEVEVHYRFIRYSGKEMDVSGLYYYGARYYAPWLQRWLSPDPASDVDGLNLYGFVGNNPVSFVDMQGNSKEKFDIVNFSNFVTTLGDYSANTLDQLLNVSARQYGVELLANAVGEFVNALAGFIGGYFGAMYIGSILPDDSHVANFTQQGKPPFSEGLIGGNIGGDIAGAISSRFTSYANLINPLVPQTSTTSVAAIDKKVGITQSSKRFGPSDFSTFFMTRGVGSVVPGMGMTLKMWSRVTEAEDIKQGLDPVKIGKIETMLADWHQALTLRMADIEKAFRRLGTDTVNPADVLPNANPLTAASSIRLDTLRAQTSAIQGYIESSQTIMQWYKEDLLTDNRFLRQQAKPASKVQKFFQPFTRQHFK